MVNCLKIFNLWNTIKAKLFTNQGKSKNCDPGKYCLTEINPIALRKTKIVYNFGLSECNRVKGLAVL